jgi:SPOR domain
VRNAFLALLLVNLAYFAWANWVDTPKPPPVNEAIGKLPHLKLVEELPPGERPQAGGAEKTALNQPTACFSVGPFGDLVNSAQAAALLKAKGFDPRQRAEEGQTSDGYWVFIGGFRNQSETDHALVTLEHNGIKDAVVMPETPDAGRRLSLGLYSEKARAERRAQAVQATGLKAEVAERKIPGTIYWVDLAPLPGTSTIPIQDLFAEGISSRIAVQPCPAATQSASTPPASAPTPPARTPVAAEPTATRIAGTPKVP